MRWQSGANTWYSNGGNWNAQPNDWSIPDWSSGDWGSQSASQTQGPNPEWGQPDWGQPDAGPSQSPQDQPAAGPSTSIDPSYPYGGQGPGGERTGSLAQGARIFSFDEGGAIPEPGQDDGSADSPDAPDALDVVRKVLGYWRKKNGINIPGEQEDAPEAQSFDDGGSVEGAAIPEQDASASNNGMEKAARLLQAYRQSWETRRHTAMAALDHGKVEDATQFATDGYNDVPNGADIKFAPSRNGVVASVSEGGKTSAHPMSTDQFRKWLASGSFDSEMDNTPSVTLQQSAKQQSFADGGEVQDDSADNDTPIPLPRPNLPVAADDVRAAVPNTELTGGTTEGIPAIGDGQFNIKDIPARVMNFLLGNVASPQEVAQAEAAVDPDGKMPPGERKAAAVEAVASGKVDTDAGTDPGAQGDSATLQQAAKGQAQGSIPAVGSPKPQTPAPQAYNVAPKPQPAAQTAQQNPETPLAQTTLQQAQKVASQIFPMASQAPQRAAYMAKIMGEGGQKYPSEERQAESKGENSLERVKLQQSGLNERASNRISYLDRSLSERAANNASRLAVSVGQMGQRQKAADLNFLGKMMTQIPPVPMEKIEAFAQQKGIPLDTLLAPPDLPQAATPSAPQSATPAAPQSVQAPPKSQAINPRAIEMLKQNASPDARMKFDQVFGRGAADRVLSGSQ